MARKAAFLLTILALLFSSQVFAGPWQDSVRDIDGLLKEAAAAYEEGRAARAKALVSRAYFDIFEAGGMEAAVGARISPVRKIELETMFAGLRGAIGAKVPPPVLKERSAVLINALRADATTLSASNTSGGNPSAWALFFNSFIIILREGFEAILVIGALGAYLVKTGHRESTAVVYRGALAALGASLVTAVFFNLLLEKSGVARETVEGVTMLLASAVLFYVSYWLITKVEAARWQRYIRSKVEDSLRGSSAVALGFAAFLAVYREGAETVLFYQALYSSAPGSGGTITAGFALGAVMLAGLFFLIKYGSVRVPLGPFFAVTSALLYYLAFTFSGRAVLELQEAGKLSATVIPGMSALPTLGIFPTWEGLALQGALVIALAGAVFYTLVIRARRRDERPAALRGT